MKAYTEEEEAELMKKEKFPKIQTVKCPHCGHNSFKILWDSTREVHVYRTWSANLVCNKCHLRCDIGGRNW